jgi:hypothetical protein
MAGFADRVAYRFAGLVWTALYRGLNRRDERDAIASIPLADDVSVSATTPAIAA